LIARFINTPETRHITEVFGSSVTARTIGELGKFVNELLEERRSGGLGIGGVIRSCEEERSDEGLSIGNRRVIIIHDFEIWSICGPIMLSRCVEFDLCEDI